MIEIQPGALEILTNEAANYPTLFLAGGITNCPDWQSDIICLLKSVPNLVIYNPRRDVWVTEEDARSARLKEQIEWEHKHLTASDTVLFWFCEETLCPITLLELGKMISTNKELIIGCHPNYARIEDVKAQVELMRPDLEVSAGWFSFINQILITLNLVGV